MCDDVQHFERSAVRFTLSPVPCPLSPVPCVFFLDAQSHNRQAGAHNVHLAAASVPTLLSVFPPSNPISGLLCLPN